MQSAKADDWLAQETRVYVGSCLNKCFFFTANDPELTRVAAL